MISLVPITAHAELLTIMGTNDEVYLFIDIDENNSNLIQIETKDNSYKYTEFEIKTYKSGAFKMSNEDITLFAHPTSDTHYRLVLFSSEPVQRLLGVTVVFDTLG